MFRILGALFALVLVFGLALGNNGKAEPQGNAFGLYGCTLVGGGERNNPGAMMQHLRDRTTHFAGNPKEVVDYYGEWDNVGELIADKCGD